MVLLLLSSFSLLTSISVTALVQQRFSKQLLDIPNDRSSHHQPTPRGGGIGFIVGFALAYGLLYLIPFWIPSLGAADILLPDPVKFWVALMPLAIVGFLDDFYSLPAIWRYLVQLSVAVVSVFWFVTHPVELGDPKAWFSLIAIAIGMTAMINFYNFMDGLDGLLAGVSAVQLAFLAIYLNLPWLWLLVAALIGFLGWNWSPAKIFMGDVGSTVLGAIVAIALLQANSASQTWVGLALTLPLIGDTIYTLVCRLIRRENIFQAHRTHLYQRLQQAGRTHAQVSSLYIIYTLLIAILIISFGQLGAWLSLASLPIFLGLGEIYVRAMLNPYGVHS
ncbi:MAG: glycosyltransferase family 4 protein [Aphanocapsa sp. GSE-SYN-MK-11-07L]|jgi:UDP-N-acetylmuramyl pentapeptide phosphotransferase/UDP-N-acetylglucosamine-1-phosphate transferase|nr:glycosyltransferase family 4 protein [Aphanocapsa sp. GSE-SYN-MK-11-07L]